ncbi:MAG: hypothetical protein Fur0041_09820 [Bacteroidia bacterium]
MKAIHPLHKTADPNRTFDNYFHQNWEAVDFLKAFCKLGFRNTPRVLITGAAGNGSSHLLHATANQLFHLYENVDLYFCSGEELKQKSPDITGNSGEMKKLMRCPYLLIDNVHECFDHNDTLALLNLLITERLMKTLPVILSVHQEHLPQLKKLLPAFDQALAIETTMPNRQSLYKMLRQFSGAHPEVELPEYLIYFALGKKFKSTKHLIAFYQMLQRGARDRQALFGAACGIMELFVNEQYKKFKRSE